PAEGGPDNATACRARYHQKWRTTPRAAVHRKWASFCLDSATDRCQNSVHPVRNVSATGSGWGFVESIHRRPDAPVLKTPGRANQMGTSIKRGAIAAIMSVIALAGLPGLPAAAASSPKAPPLAAGAYRQLPAPELVNVRQLRGAAPGAHSSLGRPKLVKNHAAAPTLPSPASGGGNRVPS